MLAQICMVASLLWSLARATVAVVLRLPTDLVRCAFKRKAGEQQNGVTFYEGEVTHVRQRPVKNSFW